MTPRTIIEAVLIVAALVVLVYAYQEHIDRVEAEAQQALLQAAADSARVEAAEAAEALEAATANAAAAAGHLDSLTAVVEGLRDSLDVVVEAVPIAVDLANEDLAEIFAEIRVQLPEPARLLVDSAQARVAEITAAGLSAVSAFETQGQAFAEFQAAADSALTAQRGETAAARALAEQWERTAAAEAARADNAEQLATPGIWSRIKSGIPFLSLSGTTGALIGAGATYLGFVATN